jgi:hypothetical protein
MTMETDLREQARRYGPNYLEIIFISMAITMTIIFAYDRYLAQKIYVFDLKGYLRTEKALLKAGEIDEADWQTSLDTIERLLDEKAVNSRHVILMGDAVLRNGEKLSLKR